MTSGNEIAQQQSRFEPSVIACDATSESTQVYRAGAYRLLAALLRAVPDRVILDQVAALAEVDSETDELARALSLLGQAAESTDVDTISDEFHALFIGVGRGELLPYGSWYLTGFLMEKPLGTLRDELARLGFVRDDGACEPEDHIAALCEVMALMIGEGLDPSSGDDFEVQQRQFFQAHIYTWAEKFFGDLSEAQSAEFYRSVGRFGLAFTVFEQRYLSMVV